MCLKLMLGQGCLYRRVWKIPRRLAPGYTSPRVDGKYQLAQASRRPLPEGGPASSAVPAGAGVSES